jgi:signal transduction histidine kinase
MLSLKQKQVLGVTTMVAAIVVALGVLHLMAVARVLLEESRARAELLASAVYHQAIDVVTTREMAYDEIRASHVVQRALESAIYAPDVTDAAIVDLAGTIVAAADPTRIGQPLDRRMTLTTVLASNGLDRLRVVYGDNQALEWSQPIELGDEPFGEIRVGLSTVLVRRDFSRALAPAALAAGISLLVAVGVSLILAQIVLRPIHVIQSGLLSLGRGTATTLDLREEEFRSLGDVFERVSAQLRAAAGPGRSSPEQLAELSRRIVALGRLTAGVAHEVKNPLNAMTIHLELLKQKLAAGAPDAGTHANVIGEAIVRLDRVVQGFLKFARPEEVRLEPVALAPLVDRVLDEVRPEAEQAGVALQRSGMDDSVMVNGDAALLHQTFVNLAQNAVQAMPNGGRLTIACAAPLDRAVVRVTDTGVGIPPEHLARIFDLYFTTKARGTGIGLSLVYRTICLLHQGSVDVESVAGRGTTFTITLPLAATGSSGSAGSAGADHEPSLRGSMSS